MTRNRAAHRVGGLLLVGWLVGVAVQPGSASAASDYTYSALATGAGYGAEYVNGDLPLITIIDLGGPTGSAQLTGSGRGSALATLPNIGDLATLPGLAQGMGVPVPDYPLLVTAEEGEPDRRVDQPSVHLLASAARTRVLGSARQGENVGGAVGSGTVVRDDATITATGISTLETLQVAPGVRVSGVNARTRAARTVAGKLTTSAHLDVADLEVAGARFSLSDGAATLAGQTVPIPLPQVFKLLAASGVTATYQQPIKTKDGILGANLVLTVRLSNLAGTPSLPSCPPAPLPCSNPLSASSQLRYVLGASSAEVSYLSYASGETSDAGPAEAGLPPVAAAPSVRLGDHDKPENFSDVVRPPISPGVTTAAVPSVASATRAASSTAGTPFADLGYIYLAIVVVALTALGSAQVVRIMGVRCAWAFENT